MLHFGRVGSHRADSHCGRGASRHEVVGIEIGRTRLSDGVDGNWTGQC